VPVELFMVSLRCSEFFAGASIHHCEASSLSSQPFSPFVSVRGSVKQLKEFFRTVDPGVLFDRGKRRSVCARSESANFVAAQGSAIWSRIILKFETEALKNQYSTSRIDRRLLWGHPPLSLEHGASLF
jgi:hypothetical protein